MDQDPTEQNKQQKEWGEMRTAGPKDKIDGDGQTRDAGKDEG